jgi:hypothetical protein
MDILRYIERFRGGIRLDEVERELLRGVWFVQLM